MKYFSRKRQTQLRFYVLVGLFTAMTLTAWANFTYIDHKAELTLEAGSKDDQVDSFISWGEYGVVNEMVLAGGVTSGKSTGDFKFLATVFSIWIHGKLPETFRRTSHLHPRRAAHQAALPAMIHRQQQPTTADLIPRKVTPIPPRLIQTRRSTRHGKQSQQ